MKRTTRSAPISGSRSRSLAIAVLALLAGGWPAAADEFYARKAQRLAAEHGFKRIAIEAAPFDLAGFLRRGAPGSPMVVVIEGDGYAFLRPDRASADPTPHDPVGLEIALAEPAGTVLALARPCQYPRMPKPPACANARWWTSLRFAPEIVDATSRAIDLVKAEVAAPRVHLVGWSGGGVLATLIAARRPDVASLVTVAAPLDLAAWTAHHRVSPLDVRPSPVDVAAGLRGVPQVHLAGARDTVVPAGIVRGFVERLPPEAGARVEIVDVDHRCCWAERWPGLRTGLPLP